MRSTSIFDFFLSLFFRLRFILFILPFLTCCGPSKPLFTYQEPSFNLEMLRNAPVVIMSSPPSVSLYDFLKTYEKLYQSNEKFMANLANNLSSGLKQVGWNVMADTTADVYDRFLNDSAKFVTANNAKYVICVRSVSIGEVNRNPVAPMGGAAVVVTTGNKSCVVTMEIVVMNIELKKLMLSFSRRNYAAVNLFAYEYALGLAVSRVEESVLKTLIVIRK